MKGKHFFILLAMAMSVVCFSSCSSDDGGDDDGGKTEQAQYAEEAACYVVLDENADLSSVELTEEGLYFIEKRSGQSAAKLARSIHKRSSKHMVTSLMSEGGDENAILSGSYTKQSEGVYQLDGYGTMTVTASGNKYVVKMQKDNGAVKTYETNRVKSAASTTFDTKLCRTWTFEKVNYTMNAGSYTLANVTATSWKEYYTKMKQLEKENCDDDDPWTDEDEQNYNKMIAYAETYGLKQVVFTAAGRFYMSYGPMVKNYLWKWKNSQSKTLWLWSYAFNDLDEDGVADANEWNSDIFFTTTDYPNYTAETAVDIKNGKLVLTDTDKETEDGFTVESKIVVTFGNSSQL